MPLYFFNIHNTGGFTPDEEGQELASPAEAHAAALAGIRSLLAGEVDQGTMDLDGRIEILDEAGKIILVVSFDEAVDVRPPGAASR